MPETHKLTWERIEMETERAEICGGWLVRTFSEATHFLADGRVQSGYDWHVALTFVPDPSHKWALTHYHSH